MPEYPGIEHAGRAIAAGMEQYHKKHVAYDQAYKLAEALGHVGYDASGNVVAIQPDAKGKVDKRITPVIDPKFLQMFQAKTQSEREKATGALEALNRIGMQSMKEGVTQSIKSRIGETGLAGDEKRAKIAHETASAEASRSLTKKRDVETGQLTGEIPKPEKPQPLPTGGQILMEQRSQRKEIQRERDNIETKMDKILEGSDPESFLDQKTWKPVDKKNYSKFMDKNAEYVQVPGMSSPIEKNKANRLNKMATRWDDLNKEHAKSHSRITAPPQAIERLINNPSPVVKAYFDLHYGGPGSADTVISAQGKMQDEKEPSKTEDTEEESTSGE